MREGTNVCPWYYNILQRKEGLFAVGRFDATHDGHPKFEATTLVGKLTEEHKEILMKEYSMFSMDMPTMLVRAQVLTGGVVPTRQLEYLRRKVKKEVIYAYLLNLISRASYIYHSYVTLITLGCQESTFKVTGDASRIRCTRRNKRSYTGIEASS